MNDLLTTRQAADALGLTHFALLNWLSRNPSYRPSQRLQSAYLWTPDEVEAARIGKAETEAQAGRRGKAKRKEEAGQKP